MNDIPSREPGKPRFLAKEDAQKSGESQLYQGRFLNREPGQSEPEPQESLWPDLDESLFSEENDAVVPPEDAAASQPEAPTDPEEPIDVDFSLPADQELPEGPAIDSEASEESLPETDDLSFLDGFLPDTSAEPEPQEPTEEDRDFEALFQAQTPAEEDIPTKTHPAKKGRPRNKTGEGLWGIPNILVTIVWIAITVAIGVTIGRMAWVCAADVLAFGREDNPVTLTITASDDIDSIANKLQSAGLIRYPGLFKLYCSFAVDDGEIQPGIWELNSLYDYHALVNMMSPSSQRSVVTVMIPEGYSCRQIFELLQQKRVCTVDSLTDYAANGELEDYWFLDGLTRGDKYCLEGYLFPDTYEFYTNDTPANVLGKMLSNFDKRVDESLREELDALNGHISDMMKSDGRGADYIASHQMTMADVITVASLIEKETASADEGYTVASVIYNRLFAWNGTPAYLNIDASIVYALDGKTDLTAADLQIDSPYNTYLNTGLTPGPIANPGLNSIKAALQPQDTDYYYYVLDPNTGVHHFSRTLQEHEAFRASLR